MTAVPFPDLPAWLLLEIADEIDQLPAAEADQARAVLARGEYVAERWPCGRVLAWSLDVGPLELLTCEPGPDDPPGFPDHPGETAHGDQDDDRGGRGDALGPR